MIKNNSVNEKESVGSLKISQEVIESIASVAASEVEGVASVADNIKSKDVFNIKKSLMSKSIKVNINNDIAVIDVYINIKHGAKIQVVSECVQKKVKDAIQSMTGIAISKVNVHIIGIEFDEEDNKDIN
ncbi:MAG: Asp23/Gls24 family envelope stress response protein [Oscillospiraceae bacterium]|nr:Asp23/Gls24 family envelope stress response protein [Oscillospiraceae bacterium]